MITKFKIFENNNDLLNKLKEYHTKEVLPFFEKLGFKNIDINFELWEDSGKIDPTQYNSPNIQIKPDFVQYILTKGDTCGWLVHETAHYIADQITKIKDDEISEYPANDIERFTYSCQFKYLQNKGINSLENLKNDTYFKHEYSGGANDDKLRIPILSLYWKIPDVWIKNPHSITKELQNLIDQQKSQQQVNEGYELSGKHSFLTFLQVISNHDFHFILNNYFTKLYNYHFFFSTETIQKPEEFVDIFKYKHSLASTYEILLKIKSNKISFFFGIKENTLLRYGFADLDSQRSYVVGEFNVTGTYFQSIAKYKALQTINKVIQNVDVKNLSTLSRVKQDFSKFYTSKKSSKIRIDDNRVINYFDKNQFTEEDLQMNRLYRILDKWISKRSWRNKVEISVDDTTDPIQFIILVK